MTESERIREMLDLYEMKLKNPKDLWAAQKFYGQLSEIQRRLESFKEMKSAIEEYVREVPDLYAEELHDGMIALTMPVEICEDLMDALERSKPEAK